MLIVSSLMKGGGGYCIEEYCMEIAEYLELVVDQLSATWCLGLQLPSVLASMANGLR